jgi:hypothetical protein
MEASWMNRVGVFCRTHVWDGYVANQAAKLCDLSKSGHFYVLADETRGTLPVEGFYKFSHCDTDFEPMGLERYFNTNLLWYNGDYPLYKIISTLPHYDWYVMVEFDVLTNVDLVSMVNEAAADGADVVAYRFQHAEPDWPWLGSCKQAYNQVWRGLIPVLAMSRLAIEYLFDKRRRLTRQFRAGEISAMPYCEGFVPSEIMGSGLFKVRDLSTFGDTSQYEFWPPVLDRRATLGNQPAFLHPVLNEERYVPNRLRHEGDPASFLNPSSRLRQEFEGCDLATVGPPLLDMLNKRGDATSAAGLVRMCPFLATPDQAG